MNYLRFDLTLILSILLPSHSYLLSMFLAIFIIITTVIIICNPGITLLLHCNTMLQQSICS
jgi:hypothetical protein